MVALNPSLAPLLRPIDTLRPDPANPRHMPDDQMAALMRSLEVYGFVEPAVVRKGDGMVIGGHQRIEAAKRLGMAAVPVVELDLTDEQARALNVALNRIHGEWDTVKLAEILAALPTDLAALTGFDEQEKHDHPTQKPLVLMTRSIENHLAPGELVYEPFGGSGTTLAAAEVTRTRCRCVELDPRYCDVIVKRWEGITGRKAERA